MSGAAHPGAPATARSLAQLTAGFAAVPAEVLVSDVTLDSRAATPGALFLACQGRTHHGVEFAADAVARGARAVLYERDGDTGVAPPRLPTGTFVAAVPKLTERAGVIADRFFGALAGTVPIPEFFAPENIGRIVSGAAAPATVAA